LTAFAACLPRELSALLESIDLSQVRSSQAWVLRAMREDGPALVRLLWRMLGREQDVLDSYQDCFCKLIALAEQDGQPPGRGYVFRTAMNVALDCRRRRKVRQDHLGAVAIARTSARAEGPSADSELLDALRVAIEDLPVRLREVIVLRDLAEMSYRDVGRTLGLTVGTARVYRREAIVALTAALREQES
jgi:RNA polymerase sigma-70 factor (ECF subfamily)